MSGERTFLQGDHLIPLRPRDSVEPTVLEPGADEAQLASMPVEGPLVDGFGRELKNLRVSVTDRCNFRCTYCMPEEGLVWLGRDEVLSYEEIERLVRLFARHGIEEVRLTGGEPLVRRDLPALVEMLSRIDGLKSLSLTTNGFRLKEMCKELVAAGLKRINVSLDTPVREKFAHITRRDALPQVLAGLEECERYPELRPIKVNAVAIRGFSEDDVLAFAELARRKPYVVRWIEFMPLDADGHWDRQDVLTGSEIRSIIESRYALVPIEDERIATAQRFAFADGAGEVGFVNPVSEPFCETCDRVRLTADGQFRTCLFSTWETDLREPLRSGANDSELEQIVRAAAWRKEMKHYINDPGFQRASRSMSQIGG
ncbi:MAG: GTP 3',8-cyclase MoaA [Dehalococcoidia bacterium]|nr:GTP 3',8-cyclase MoaA [Dehalococcoidia bacterium]